MRKILLTTLFGLGFGFAAAAQDQNQDLFQAIHDQNARKVAVLLDEQQADPNAVLQLGPGGQVSALTLAVNTSSVEVVKLLVQHQAQLEWKDWFDTTALVYAAGIGNKEMVEYLLESGADIRANDGQGNTVLTAAQESKNKSLVRLVESRMAGR